MSSKNDIDVDNSGESIAIELSSPPLPLSKKNYSNADDDDDNNNNRKRVRRKTQKKKDLYDEDLDLDGDKNVDIDLNVSDGDNDKVDDEGSSFEYNAEPVLYLSDSDDANNKNNNNKIVPFENNDNDDDDDNGEDDESTIDAFITFSSFNISVQQNNSLNIDDDDDDEETTATVEDLVIIHKEQQPSLSQNRQRSTITTTTNNNNNNNNSGRSMFDSSSQVVDERVPITELMVGNRKPLLAKTQSSEQLQDAASRGQKRKQAIWDSVASSTTNKSLKSSVNQRPQSSSASQPIQSNSQQLELSHSSQQSSPIARRANQQRTTTTGATVATSTSSATTTRTTTTKRRTKLTDDERAQRRAEQQQQKDERAAARDAAKAQKQAAKLAARLARDASKRRTTDDAAAELVIGVDARLARRGDGSSLLGALQSGSELACDVDQFVVPRCIVFYRLVTPIAPALAHRTRFSLADGRDATREPHVALCLLGDEFIELVRRAQLQPLLTSARAAYGVDAHLIVVVEQLEAAMLKHERARLTRQSDPLSRSVSSFDSTPFQRMKYFVELHFSNVHVEETPSIQRTVDYIVNLAKTIGMSPYRPKPPFERFDAKSLQLPDGAKKDTPTWQRMLMHIQGVSLAIAMAITAQYGSFRKLVIEQYRNPALTQQQKELLLAKIIVVRTTNNNNNNNNASVTASRPIGAVVSKRIYETFK